MKASVSNITPHKRYLKKHISDIAAEGFNLIRQVLYHIEQVLYQTSPGLYQTSPGLYHFDPVLYQTSPGLYHPDPILYQTSPGSYHFKPGLNQTSAGLYHFDTVLYQTSPGLYYNDRVLYLLNQVLSKRLQLVLLIYRKMKRACPSTIIKDWNSHADYILTNLKF